MRRVTRDKVVYLFSKAIPPVLTVDPGETLLLETLDARSGAMKTIEDFWSYERDPSHLNPVTGPVAVRGAAPGDTLVIEIDGIELDRRGWTFVSPEEGIAADEVSSPQATFVAIEDDLAIFAPNIRLPIRPMVGTIGTCPADREIGTIHPGPHGGNLDIPAVAVGSRVYLPVMVDEALFCLGDVHAAQGDGEITGTAIEISAQVRVRVDLIKERAWPRPWIETSESWTSRGHAPTLEDAGRLAVVDMANMLVEILSISKEEAFLLIGSAGDLRLGQAAMITGIDVTAWVAFPNLGAERPQFLAVE